MSSRDGVHSMVVSIAEDILTKTNVAMYNRATSRQTAIRRGLEAAMLGIIDFIRSTCDRECEKTFFFCGSVRVNENDEKCLNTNCCMYNRLTDTTGSTWTPIDV